MKLRVKRRKITKKIEEGGGVNLKISATATITATKIYIKN